MKRIFTWGAFIVIIGLIIWGMVAAQNKESKSSALIPLPTEITSADHVLGTSTAPVTLVEYGDFQCPACGQYFPIVERVLASSTNPIRFVFRHFPLTQHANAIPASLASEAAGAQGKFFDMYRKLYYTQSEWSELSKPETVFEKYAAELNLDVAKFSADVKSEALMNVVLTDYKSGTKAGINATPTFFVNGKQINNPRDYEDFKTIIDTAATSGKPATN